MKKLFPVGLLSPAAHICLASGSIRRRRLALHMAHMLALLLGAIAAIQPPSSSAAAAAAPASPARQAGILYELWHTEAAAAMAQVKSQGLPILTTERVIRSDGKTILDDVYRTGRTHRVTSTT